MKVAYIDIPKTGTLVTLRGLNMIEGDEVAAYALPGK